MKTLIISFLSLIFTRFSNIHEAQGAIHEEGIILISEVIPDAKIWLVKRFCYEKMKASLFSFPMTSNY